MPETFLKMNFLPGIFQGFCSNLIHLYRFLKDLEADLFLGTPPDCLLYKTTLLAFREVLFRKAVHGILVSYGQATLTFYQVAK